MYEVVLTMYVAAVYRDEMNMVISMGVKYEIEEMAGSDWNLKSEVWWIYRRWMLWIIEFAALIVHEVIQALRHNAQLPLKPW